MDMAEEMVKLLDMSQDLVAQYGPTDASLLTLAQKHFDVDPVILTIDHDLCSECWNNKIRAVQIYEIF